MRAAWPFMSWFNGLYIINGRVQIMEIVVLFVVFFFYFILEIKFRPNLFVLQNVQMESLIAAIF